MNDSSWDLVIPVLIVGLTLGIVWAAFWRQKRSRAAESDDRDRRLRLADLEARQALLYDQLREASGDEREALELAAARNLMAIEEAGGTVAGTAAGSAEANDRAGAEGGATAPSSTAAAPAAGTRPSAWLGFVGGAATAALIGMLVVWAQRDAKPRPDDGFGGAMTAPPEAGERPHPEGPPLSEREREALAQLSQRIVDDPTDLMARKQYAVGLLSTGRFMGAFEQAEVLLGSDPDDPDGLYVKGMVRMRMGQEAEARALLDRLLIGYPEHVPALTALGVLALRSGGLPEAEEYWDKAVELSGGSNPEVERLRAAAREQFEQMAEGAGSVTASAGAAAPAAPSAVPPAAPPATLPEPLPAPLPAPLPSAGSAYTLQIDLAPGADAPPSAVLFVALRAGAGGPPSAVKRIAGPRFPLTLTLTGSDTMMGQPLPESGVITARLDADGSASTRDEGEPEAQAEMRAGDTATLRLQ